MADEEKVLENEEQVDEQVATEEETGPVSDSFELDLEDEEEYDSLTFSNGVIEKIVALAVRDVPGVLGMKGGWVNMIQDAFGQTALSKGVTIDSTDDGSLIVNVSVFVEYGAYAPQVFESIKSAIVEAMDRMTGLTVVGVNLNIADVLTPEEAARRNPQPRLEAPADGEAAGEEADEPEIETPEDGE